MTFETIYHYVTVTIFQTLSFCCDWITENQSDVPK